MKKLILLNVVFSMFALGDDLPQTETIQIRLGTDIGTCQQGQLSIFTRKIVVEKHGDRPYYSGKWSDTQSFDGVTANFEINAYHFKVEDSWQIRMTFLARLQSGEIIATGLTYFEADPEREITLKWEGPYIQFSGNFEDADCRKSLGFALKKNFN